MMFSKFKFILILAFFYASPTLSIDEQTLEQATRLSDQLYDLAEQHQFEILGIGIIGEAEQRRAQGNELALQLKQLLEGYNYVLISDDNKQLQRLVIINKTSFKQKEIILDTLRKGHQHYINASLQGLNNHWLSVQLLVDTGADRIVVPKSLISPLGFDPDQLEIARLQTVNGTLEAQIGKLKAITLNNQIINDVDIAFVDDDLLGNVMLLGMNVLSQYRVILDHESNQITLIEK